MKKMRLTLIAMLAIAATAHAGEGLHMKCQAPPTTDPGTGAPAAPCGYETLVTFGGGMFYQQTTGYCRACKKFVYLSWTRANLPPGMKDQVKVKARPAPLGEVWDAATGTVLTIHACPTCKGPFLAIDRSDQLKHCPVCNKPYFKVDTSQPQIAID